MCGLSLVVIAQGKVQNKNWESWISGERKVRDISSVIFLSSNSNGFHRNMKTPSYHLFSFCDIRRYFCVGKNTEIYAQLFSRIVNLINSFFAVPNKKISDCLLLNYERLSVVKFSALLTLSLSLCGRWDISH